MIGGFLFDILYLGGENKKRLVSNHPADSLKSHQMVSFRLNYKDCHHFRHNCPVILKSDQIQPNPGISHFGIKPTIRSQDHLNLYLRGAFLLMVRHTGLERIMDLADLKIDREYVKAKVARLLRFLFG